jgi:peptidyl-prolyl cis-trans isomerase C
MQVSRFAIFVAATLFAAPAIAQTDKPVAKIDGMTITEKDLQMAQEDLGERLPQGASEEQKRDYLVGYLADLRLGARAADVAKIGETPEFRARLDYFRQKVLLDEYLSREAKKAVTPEAARKLYDETVKSLTAEEEVRARHILVEDEAQAKAALDRVRKGEDFAKIAAELSKDPGSGKEGGDLGYFTKDRMVAPFAEAAFKMTKGEVSEPVKSQFGWHVIKVEDRRAKALPEFEAVKGEIETYLLRKGQQDVIMALRGTTKTERLDLPAAAKPADAKPGDAKPAEPKKP